MKRIHFSIVVIFATLLIVSCVKDDEVEVADEPQVFNLDIAGMSDAQGSKLVWDSAGYLWWSESGDYVNINGAFFQVIYDGGWKAVGSGAEKDHENYNICYMGSSTNNGNWSTDNQLFTGVSFSGIVPLVGRGTSNNLTLRPCCAVLKCTLPAKKVLSQIEFTYADTNNKFSAGGSLNPDTKLVENSTGELLLSEESCFTREEGNNYYVVLPMTNGTCTLTKIIFHHKTIKSDGTLYRERTVETSKTITITRGVFYTIDGTSW